MNWILIEERKPDVGKVVLLCSSYEGWSVTDYAIGYLGSDGVWNAETEGLYLGGDSSPNDIELGFDPTHWVTIDPPEFKGE